MEARLVKNREKYRMRALYLGYQSYRMGANSEWIRHFFQNQMIHGSFIANQRMFEMTDNKTTPYAQYQTQNQYTSW